MKVSAIVQARTGSTRLPDKVLKEICKTPVLIHVINRIKMSESIDEIIIATTQNPNDDRIVDLLKNENIIIYRGSEEDVLERYYEAAKYNNSNIVVRVTSDDPLIDYRLIDDVIKNLMKNNADYSCNNMPSTYPLGLDCECFTFEVLEKAYYNAKGKREREHVTPYIREHKDLFKIVSINSDVDYSHLRWTLDTQEDYIYIKEIFEYLYKKNKRFVTEDIISFLQETNRL